MKIYNINPVVNTQTQYNTSFGNQRFSSLPLENNVSALNFPSETSGRSQVSFKRRELTLSDIENMDIPVNNNFFHIGTNKPDPSQILCAKIIHNKKYDLTHTAPTGNGKTAIAVYAIEEAVSRGEKAIYLNPLIALNTEKFQILVDIHKALSERFGEAKVGIITGDTKINPDAQVLIATTEVLDNHLELPITPEAIQRNLAKQKGLGTVIIDEAQSMGEPGRGSHVESVKMKLDKNVQIVSLSGTFGNADEEAAWNTIQRGRQTFVVSVPQDQRRVPLVWHTDKVYGKPKEPFGNEMDLIQDLKAQGNNSSMEKGKLPAAFFIHSKRKIAQFINTLRVRSLSDKNFVLTTSQEQAKIQKLLDEYDKQGIYLGEEFDTKAILHGYAPHSSGLVPTQKAFVETLLREISEDGGALLKVMACTYTVGAGINAPISTTVHTSPRIPTERRFADGPDGKRMISVNESQQEGGRAGRPGHDKVGHSHCLPTTEEEQKTFKHLSTAAPDSITSQFETDYSMIARYHREVKDDVPMKEFLAKTFKVYDKDQKKAEEKLETLYTTFTRKREILKNLGFVNYDNSLTFKGFLLSKIHGYSPIPIVDMVSKRMLSADSPVELAASIAALANADESVADRKEREKEFQAQKAEQQAKMNRKGKKKAKTKEPLAETLKPFEKENPILKGFMDKLTEHIKIYNGAMKVKVENYFPIDFDKDVVQHIYEWTKLNAQNPGDLKGNWAKLYYSTQANEQFADQGGMFKEMTRTSDLIKQVGSMAKQALELEESAAHKEYYEALEKNAQETLKFLDTVKVLFKCR